MSNIQFQHATPAPPVPGPATGSSNGLHPKSKFITVAVATKVAEAVEGDPFTFKPGSGETVTLESLY